MVLHFVAWLSLASISALPCWDILNHWGKSDHELETLQQLMARLEPIVIEARARIKGIDPKRLCSRDYGHCGVTTRFNGHLLGKHGYSFQQAISSALPEMWNLGTYDGHTFIVATLSDGREIIIDGAYIQYLKILDPEDKYLPDQSILILHYDRRSELIEQIVNLWHTMRSKDAYWKSWEGGERHFQTTFNILDTEEKVRRVFSEVWNYKSPLYSTTPYITEPLSGNHPILKSAALDLTLIQN